MQIVYFPIEDVELETFADKHGLVMDVNEVEIRGARVWHARFRDVEATAGASGGLLESVYGSGGTPGEAIKDYANTISERNLIYMATSKTARKAIRAPRLTYAYP